MLTATCHCGAVRVEVPDPPQSLTDCNCSICRRYGTLWAYYEASTVRILAAQDATADYVWGDKRLRFVRCAHCGCVTHWAAIERTPTGKMGVNARNFEPNAIAEVHIRRLDGASTWEYLD
jgi:hypothetical protein